jgi:hypothetical protein
MVKSSLVGSLYGPRGSLRPCGAIVDLAARTACECIATGGVLIRDVGTIAGANNSLGIGAALD